MRLHLPREKLPFLKEDKNEFFHLVYAFMHLRIMISALLHLLHFVSLYSSLVYPPFVCIFHGKCSEDVTEVTVLRNISGVTDRVHWVQLHRP